MKLDIIIESYINGNYKQTRDYIKKYGKRKFFIDLKRFYDIEYFLILFDKYF